MDTITIHDGREVSAPRLLAALYNNTRPLGLGAIAAMSAPSRMTEDGAREVLEAQGSFSFDYLGGRPLKVHCRDNVLDAHSIALYERDAGSGAFERAMEEATGA